MLFYLAKGHFHACAAVVPMPGWMAWLKRTVNACWRVFLFKICILAFNQRRFAQIFYSKYAGSETVTTAVVVWVRRRRRQPIMIDDDNRNNSRIHFLHLSRAIKKTWIHIWFESWWWRCWESEQSFVAELTHILPCKMYYYYICANTLNVNVRMLRWVLTHKIKFIERIAFKTEIHTTNDELANIIHYVFSSPTLFSFRSQFQMIHWSVCRTKCVEFYALIKLKKSTLAPNRWLGSVCFVVLCLCLVCRWICAFWFWQTEALTNANAEYL